MFDKDANVIQPNFDMNTNMTESPVKTGSVVINDSPSRKGDVGIPNIRVGSISSRREKDHTWNDAVVNTLSLANFSKNGSKIENKTP